MSTKTKYRLGSQSEPTELWDEYLGWIPEGTKSWDEFLSDYYVLNTPKPPSTVTLVSPNGEEKVTFDLHHGISKDAFPLEFFGEERAKNWHKFYFVSKMGAPETKFVIPMH